MNENPQMKDVRSDIYSAGAIFYYLLCGRAPTGGDPEKFLRETNTELSEIQISVIMKSLSINIDNRYTNCTEMIKAIEESRK